MTSLQLPMRGLLLSLLLLAGCGGSRDPNASRAPAGPPPAWLETQDGSVALDVSTFCWKSVCADYKAPSCTGAQRARQVSLQRGEWVTAHLGFKPRELTLITFAEPRLPQAKPKQQRLPAVTDPVWRVKREGAFSLFAIAERGGDASYVACVEFNE